MAKQIAGRLEGLADHYTPLCLALSLVILALTGVGDLRITGLLGLILCLAGLTQDAAQVDLWTLVPLVVYDLAALASSYAAYGNLADGYGAMHALFPVIYLLMGCLDRENLELLRRCGVLWAGFSAAAGIGMFVFEAFTQGRVGRLSGLPGNPNAMGIFLVIGSTAATPTNSGPP